jgi:hypothetical protein
MREGKPSWRAVAHSPIVIRYGLADGHIGASRAAKPCSFGRVATAWSAKIDSGQLCTIAPLGDT